MKRPREQRGLFSRLPDDPGYWQMLTDRIVDDGVPVLQARREESRKWWSGMARFSTVLAVGASAATIGTLLLMPAGTPAITPVQMAHAYGLAPDDALAAALVSGEAPPSMETLMAVRTAERDR
jgi:hypothetical protein